MRRHFTLVEVLVCAAIIGLVAYAINPALAFEFHTDKAVAFNFTAPLVNSTDNVSFATGANNTAFYVHSNDNTTFAAAATNCTHIVSGIYLFQLNATEMNHTQVGVLYNGTGCLANYWLINTAIKEAVDTVDGIVDDILTDTAAMDTADELRTLLTGGTSALSTLTASDNIGINWADVANPTTSVTLSGTTVGTATAVTNGVTVTTNNDKTGYTASISNGGITSGTFAAGTAIPLVTAISNGGITLSTFSGVLPTNFPSLSIDANGRIDVLKIAGTMQTARDLGASVLLSPGTGTGQVNLSSGAVPVYSISNGAITSGTFGAGATLPVVAAISNGAITAGTAPLLANLDAAISTRSSHSAADIWAVGTRALTDKANFTLSSDYDAAKSAGTSTLTVAQLEARTLPAADYFDPAVDAVATVTTLTNAPADSAGVTTLLGRLTATRAGYLDNLTNLDATVSSRGTSTLTGDAVKTVLEADGSKLDHLWETTEDDGGVRRFTQNALEQAPSGGATTAQIVDAILDESLGAHTGTGSVGAKLNDLPLSGTGDWTDDEKEDILAALGVADGTASQTLDTLYAEIRKMRGR